MNTLRRGQLHSRKSCPLPASSGEKAGGTGAGQIGKHVPSGTSMDFRKTLLLLLLVDVLLLEADAARPRGPGRGGGRGRVRGHSRGRVRGRGKGRHRVKKPVVSKTPERVPVYLELPGEEHPIPVYPLAPGSGHQPFTVKVASAHLAGSPAEQTGPFEPPQKVQTFSAADAGGRGASPGSAGSGEASLPGSGPTELPTPDPDPFGADFFESGAGFASSPPHFPSFQTAFEGVPSRRRGARRLVPPTQVSGATDQVSEVTAQASPPEIDQEYAGIKAGGDPDPPYQFGYVVNGGLAGATFGRQEAAAAGLTRGRYEVQLPDGRIQVVTYTAGGQRGFEADVQYIEQADAGAA